MFGQVGHSARVDVGSRAKFKRYPAVPDITGQPAKGYPAVVVDGDVVHETNPVPQPLGAAPLQGLPDRREPERLACMDGGMKVFPLDERERLEVQRRGVPHLGPGYIEARDTDVAVADRQFGDLERSRSRAHRREQRPHHDGGPSVSGVLHACGEPS